MPEVMKELTLLFLDHTAIKELPSSIERLLGLELLSMRNYLSDRVHRRRGRMNTVLGIHISPQWTEKVRVTSDTVPECVNDGFSWRKGGPFPMEYRGGPFLVEYRGGPYPRVSYACTGCCAMKTVQRSKDDPKFIEISYQGMHTCKQVPFIRSSLMISRIEPMNLEELATGLQVIINELS